MRKASKFRNILIGKNLGIAINTMIWESSSALQTVFNIKIKEIIGWEKQKP